MHLQSSAKHLYTCTTYLQGPKAKSNTNVSQVAPVHHSQIGTSLDFRQNTRHCENSDKPKDPFPVTKLLSIIYLYWAYTVVLHNNHRKFHCDKETSVKKLRKFQPLSHDPKIGHLNDLTPCHELRVIFKQQEDMYGHTDIRLEGV